MSEEQMKNIRRKITLQKFTSCDYIKVFFFGIFQSSNFNVYHNSYISTFASPIFRHFRFLILAMIFFMLWH